MVLRVVKREAGKERKTFFDFEVHCDTSVVSEQEISPRLYTGNTTLSQFGNSLAVGGGVSRERHDHYQMVSHENWPLQELLMGLRDPHTPEND